MSRSCAVILLLLSQPLAGMVYGWLTPPEQCDITIIVSSSEAEVYPPGGLPPTPG